MASREQRDEIRRQNMQRNKEKAFQASCATLKPFPIIAACVLVLAVLLMLVPFAEVYNTDINGPEVKVSGWSFAIAAVTGGYSSVSSVYGDMAVPFFYYAESYCLSLAPVALISLILLLVGIVLEIVARVKQAPVLNCAAAAVCVVAAILLIVCTSIARGMNNSDILPYYCQGNPACSIRSYAAFPAIIALVAAGLNILASVKYFAFRKELKAQ